MKSTLKLVFGLFVGAAGGAIVNMGLIVVGSELIPAPAGIDVTSTESLAASGHLLEPQHFVFPLFAHAGGTLAGCLIACMIARHRPRASAIGVGCIFLAGGIANVFMIPAPVWFIALDLVLAYLPMAFLAMMIFQRLEMSKGSSA